MSKADDLEQYEIPADLGDLNYTKYISEDGPSYKKKNIILKTLID